MNQSLWRAAAIPIPGGVVAVDVAGSGRLAQHVVSLEHQGVSQPISSLEELANALASTHSTAKELAESDPVSFAFLVCVVSDRPYRILSDDSSLWPDLERHFHVERSPNRPRVEGERLIFVASSQYMPVLRASRLTVDLRTLEVTEEPLVNAPWPPVTAAAV